MQNNITVGEWSVDLSKKRPDAVYNKGYIGGYHVALSRLHDPDWTKHLAEKIPNPFSEKDIKDFIELLHKIDEAGVAEINEHNYSLHSPFSPHPAVSGLRWKCPNCK